MKKPTLRIAVILCAIFLSSCTNEKAARKALEMNGFKDVQMTGYKIFECSKDDFYHTGFKAINPKGDAVSGTVCTGFWLKGSTVRW